MKSLSPIFKEPLRCGSLAANCLQSIRDPFSLGGFQIKYGRPAERRGKGSDAAPWNGFPCSCRSRVHVKPFRSEASRSVAQVHRKFASTSLLKHEVLLTSVCQA